MSKDLTTSKIDRQNILNNPFAIEEVRTATGISGIVFEGEFKFLKDQLAKFFEVEPRTIERYIENNTEELSTNGYEVLRGNRLKEFKLALKSGDVNDMNVVNKAPQVGVFNFRAFLDLAMLLTESDRAKSLRSVILDIVINTVNKKTGGVPNISIKEMRTLSSIFFGEKIIAKNSQMLCAIMLKWEKQNIQFIPIKYTRAYLKRILRNIGKY